MPIVVYVPGMIWRVPQFNVYSSRPRPPQTIGCHRFWRRFARRSRLGATCCTDRTNPASIFGYIKKRNKNFNLLWICDGENLQCLALSLLREGHVGGRLNLYAVAVLMRENRPEFIVAHW